MAPENLQRFVAAQDQIYSQVRAELGAGVKQSHWMWFVFPQLQGLGRSSMAVKFGIESAQQARAYWHYDTLGSRLKECVLLALAVKGETAFQIFGKPDDLKFRSSMTLFAHAVPEESAFKEALQKYFNGADDQGRRSCWPEDENNGPINEAVGANLACTTLLI